MSAPQHIVVMGVSGCGKSTTGAHLAERLGWPFLEGDRFHPTANVEKMRAGIALNDEDRAPWLQALAEEFRRDEALGRSSVMGCSSLKRSYRDILRSGASRVRFLHVNGTRELLQERLQQRFQRASGGGIATLDRFGEARAELFLAAEQAGVEEARQVPQLAQMVLHRGAGGGDAEAGLQPHCRL
jgi:carbohydrate kinase (thermoresistant glucokinase family)